MHSIDNNKILFLVQLPPPVHGVSMMNEITVNSPEIIKLFDIQIVSLNYSKEIKGIGKFSFEKTLLFLRIYGNIIKQLTNFKPDMVYFTLTPTGNSFYRDVLIVILLKLSKAKIIYHLHGKGIYNKTKNSKILRIIYKWVFKNTHVIHLSEILKEDISMVNNKVKSYIIPNGIKRLNCVNKKSGNDNPKRLLFLSNLAENKGLIMFLFACKFLKANNIPFDANIVGRETNLISEQDIKDKITELNLDKEVTYLGPKYDNEKEAILENSEIFVFPTYNDCFPLVLLEALKHGLPVISTNEGAISEIIDDGKNGYVVERKDQEQLNTKLKELILDEKKIQEFSKNSRVKFNKCYTTEIYEKNMLSVLKNIANG